MSAATRARTGVALAAAVLVGAAFVPGGSASAGDTTEWSLSPSDSDSSRTVSTDGDAWRLADGASAELSAGAEERTGIVTFPPRDLTRDATTIAATVEAAIPDDASAAVDVRGQRADGSWSQWTEIRPDAPAVLSAAASTVQTRLVLSAPSASPSPQVRAIELAASRDETATATPQLRNADGDTYRVFATREGLVGGTTANGHVIVERDHFVALPSRRGLADDGDGSYTTQVCTEDGSRCEWAPVWDVGPWNTKDDYWNDDREEWQDLPKGTPQAQAAYQDGYNGGKDEFGRDVANPAGIDLADGTFWDGLGFTDNAWVDVTYEWTGSGAWGTVDIEGMVLTVRSEPTTESSEVGLAARHAQPRIECVTQGETVDGSQGSTDEWFRLDDGKFVSAAYVAVGESPDSC